MTNDFAQILQKQLEKQAVGGVVKCILRNGHEITGSIVEFGGDYLLLRRQGSQATLISLAAVDVLDIPDGTAPLVSDLPVIRNAVVDAPALVQIESVPALGPEVLKRLEELVAHIERKTADAKIEVSVPDLREPVEELRSLTRRDVLSEWGRIQNMFNNAKRVNELDRKYNRIQVIVSNTKDLVEQVPNSISLKRQLAYFQYLADTLSEALVHAEEVAFASSSARDWLNVAAYALQNASDTVASNALERAFARVAITDVMDAWYVYVRLLHNSAGALRNIYHSTERAFSEVEEQLIFETCLYLLKKTDKEAVALDLLRKAMGGIAPGRLLPEALKWFGEIPHEYQRIAEELRAARERLLSEMQTSEESAPKESLNGASEEKKPVVPTAPQQLLGHIYTYKAGRNFGFLFGPNGMNYFFHRSAILDEDLLEHLESLTEPVLKPTEHIAVTFEIMQGPKGLVAVNLAPYRKIEDIFETAYEYADAGEYAKAVNQVRSVLARDPEYPGAQEAYERWNRFAQVARSVGAPIGSNPYARGRRAVLVEKDNEKAIQFFQQAIDTQDNVEASIKELASLLGRSGRGREAIELLDQYRDRISNQQTVDNLLSDIYQRLGEYGPAIELLEKSLAQATTKERRARILSQIASCYLLQNDYVNAEQRFREVMNLGFNRRDAKKNVALCLVKQHRYDEAEQLLNEILETATDEQALEMLEAITRARQGQSSRIDEIISETKLSSFTSDLSSFAQFFLNASKYQGVRPERVQQKRFERYDVRRLEELATQLGTRNPRERSEYYLSAAKIISEMEDWDDPRQMYKYLCRSFASRGDATLLENRPFDAAREWYCEALAAYDGARARYREDSEGGSQRDEQDAVNALVRYLSSTLGSVQMTRDNPSIDDTLDEVFRLNVERERLFDLVTYLLMRSRYAAQRTVNRLYDRQTLRALAVQYLQSQNVGPISTLSRADEFMQRWNELRRRRFEEARAIANELGLISKMELTVASLENYISSLDRVRDLGLHLLFDLDQQRLRQVRRMLEMLVDQAQEITFEDQERLCTLVIADCQTLLREIEEAPTRLAVEELYPIIETIKEMTSERLESIYARSVPQITLRLPEDMESYTPEMGKIEVQVVVANKIGCSPAESLELVAQEDEDFFQADDQALKLNSSLRGGDQKILTIRMRVTELARQSEAFSLPVYAQYRTRSGEMQRTSVENFSIRLYKEEQFERIENPYAGYAKGGAVESNDMFYGRDELITNVASAIRATRSESKSVVIFGQKRAGKTSILYHLQEALACDPDLLILDIGNVALLLDEKDAQSGSSFLHQLLWTILRKLRWAIEDAVDAGKRPPLDIAFPNSREFFEHGSPLSLFEEIFDNFKRAVARIDAWRGVRVVLLIDEFSYIYEYIIQGRISEDFMKIWKALLQRNYFSAVLVGQDVMVKFKKRFPNEFGTSQDVRVNYLKYQDAVRLIDDPLRIGGKSGESRFREKAIDRIFDLSAGSPFYIQIICNQLVEYMNRKHARLVTDADVEQVKNELVRGDNRLDEDAFDNLLSSGDKSSDAISVEDAKKVLVAIAANTRLGSCDRESIVSAVSGTRAPVEAILADLAERDVIEVEKRRYRIRVGLFKEWLLAQA